MYTNTVRSLTNTDIQKRATHIYTWTHREKHLSTYMQTHAIYTQKHTNADTHVHTYSQVTNKDRYT